MEKRNPFTSADRSDEPYKAWEGLQEEEADVLQDVLQGSIRAMEPIDRTKQVCRSTPEQDDVMIFEKKVRLVSPVWFAKVLVMY